MPPHMYEQWLELNSDVYVVLLNNVCKTWLKGAIAGRPYMRGRKTGQVGNFVR